MISSGKRNFYVIQGTSWYDSPGEGHVWLVTDNAKEAIERFEWMYNDVKRDYIAEENGEIVVEDHGYELNKLDKGIIEGEFHFIEDYDGGCRFTLETIRTHCFKSRAATALQQENCPIEQRYRAFKGGN